mgnify:CR=1 FL=1
MTNLQTRKVSKKRSTIDFYGGAPSLRGSIIKIFLLGLVDAIALFVAFILAAEHRYDWLTGLVITVAALNWVYLRRGGLAAKYIAPGLVLLIFFQIYVVLFSGWTAFTNYGTTHNGSQADAVTAIQQSAFAPVDGSAIYNLTLAKDKSGNVTFIMVDPNNNNQVLVGSQTQPAKDVTGTPGVTVDQFGVAKVAGYTPMTPAEVNKIGTQLLQIKVPAGADLNKDGFYTTTDAASAQLNKYSLIYKNGNFVSLVDGTTYKPTAEGFFTNEKGKSLPTGWSVPVGFKNFERIFTNQQLRGPLLKVLTWTVIFAILSVVTTFVVGLALALLFHDDRLKGKAIYRSLVILPYAFPAFLSAYIWKGLFQTQNGYINQAFFHFGPFIKNPIPWLEDPTMAKVAILLMNLWLGFPYMFLISTGALQAIPSELSESATIDGATAWQQLRLIKLPLLLVSLGPLLISSFAFNFNNFTAIYLLTGGGPSSSDASSVVDAGGTDILITFVYKIAFFSSQGRDFGLASAFSLLIFLIVGGSSLVTFRRTRSLEDMN